MTSSVPPTLGRLKKGQQGVILRLSPSAMNQTALPFAEVERRFLEMGLVEGAKVRLIHEGPFGGDPIVVQVGESRIAIRRNEANAIWIEVTE
jgi:ferrous iron transport protein A